ncbi:TetR/AcrR family transcriptional regulator [Trebonia kvetii]|uniref:TetR/AcrR family transcriptional regulator n=1 Tax=Trebonia kvetii TaxID=2480626 RepID=UPI001C9E2A3F|nr:TetR/AcrR family transcriptional regulator [Trebonia kvetii]
MAVWQTDDEVGQHDAGDQTLTDPQPPDQAPQAFPSPAETPPQQPATYRAAPGDAATRTRDRIARRKVDKFTERREQLAAAALATLAEQGYANTSLRDIAQHSDFSHGVLHYYFADKFELIIHCVSKYKAECVTRYDELVASATSADELRYGIGAAMASTLRDDATMQRLWYDLRNQSLFEERFRATVREIDQSLEEMIWRIVSRYAELSESPLAVSPAMAYALMDGLFRQALLAQLSGDAAAGDMLDKHITQLLPGLLG